MTTTTFTVTNPPVYAGSVFVDRPGHRPVRDGDLGGRWPAGRASRPESRSWCRSRGRGLSASGCRIPNLPYDPVNNPLVPITTGGNTTADQLRRPHHPDPPDGRRERLRRRIRYLGAADPRRSSSIRASPSPSRPTARPCTRPTTTASGSSSRRPAWPGSTTGTLIGLNDLRTLGVPYEGQNSAVAVVDTGVDANSPPFRGRVAPGKNIWTGGLGNKDLAVRGRTGGTQVVPEAAGCRRRRRGRDGTTGGGNVLPNTFDGHGTPVAGVVAQFVPQATIEPVSIFQPFGFSDHVDRRRRAPAAVASAAAAAAVPVAVAAVAPTGDAATSIGVSNDLTTTNAVYNGMAYVAKHPFVNDPIRPGKVEPRDRVHLRLWNNQDVRQRGSRRSRPIPRSSWPSRTRSTGSGSWVSPRSRRPASSAHRWAPGPCDDHGHGWRRGRRRCRRRWRCRRRRRRRRRWRCGGGGGAGGDGNGGDYPGQLQQRRQQLRWATSTAWPCRRS